MVLDVGFMRPLLVWRGYWIDEGYVMDGFKDTGGNAFPYSGVHSFQGRGGITVDDRGMSLRDYFAAKAMQSLTVVYWEEVDKYESAAELIKCQSEAAYEIADAMLKARNQ